MAKKKQQSERRKQQRRDREDANHECARAWYERGSGNVFGQRARLRRGKIDVLVEAVERDPVVLRVTLQKVSAQRPTFDPNAELAVNAGAARRDGQVPLLTRVAEDVHAAAYLFARALQEDVRAFEYRQDDPCVAIEVKGRGASIGDLNQPPGVAPKIVFRPGDVLWVFHENSGGA